MPEHIPAENGRAETDRAEAEEERLENDRSADRPEKDRPKKDRPKKDRPKNDRADDRPADADDDRRRSPRFSCSGQAKISCLPSSGIVLPGTIRDLSLHGCCVDIPQRFDCGVQAEIVVRVNAASFRAVGEVKAIRGPSAAGMEFVHLSAGGRDLLADLVSELARLQAAMNRLRSARREIELESFKKQLENGKLQAALLSSRFPSLSRIPEAVSLETDVSQSDKISAKNEEDRTLQTLPLLIRVDLFG